MDPDSHLFSTLSLKSTLHKLPACKNSNLLPRSNQGQMFHCFCVKVVTLFQVVNKKKRPFLQDNIQPSYFTHFLQLHRGKETSIYLSLDDSNQHGPMDPNLLHRLQWVKKEENKEEQNDQEDGGWSPNTPQTQETHPKTRRKAPRSPPRTKNNKGPRKRKEEEEEERRR